MQVICGTSYRFPVFVHRNSSYMTVCSCLHVNMTVLAIGQRASQWWCNCILLFGGTANCPEPSKQRNIILIWRKVKKWPLFLFFKIYLLKAFQLGILLKLRIMLQCGWEGEAWQLKGICTFEYCWYASAPFVKVSRFALINFFGYPVVCAEILFD